MDYQCPKCESQDVVNYSVLHRASQNKGLLSHGTVFAPPTKKSTIGSVLMGLFFLACANYADGDPRVVFIVVGLGCILFAIHAYKYNKDKFASIKEKWKRSYYCNRCGHSFLHEE